MSDITVIRTSADVTVIRRRDEIRLEFANRGRPGTKGDQGDPGDVTLLFAADNEWTAANNFTDPPTVASVPVATTGDLDQLDIALSQAIVGEAGLRDDADATLGAALADEALARETEDDLRQLRSEKGAPLGYAGLDPDGFVIEASIPPSITRDTELADAVLAIVAGAPGALDTLLELATALGNDPNLAATLTTLIGTKLAKAADLADLASPATARTNLGLGTAATHPATDFDAAGAAAAEAIIRAAEDALRIPLTQRGVADGVATLDGSVLIPDAQIPSTITRDSELTAAISAAIAGVIASAPGTLDTLNELATALGNDPAFATTITALIAAKISATVLDANSALIAVTDDTPVALPFAASTIMARLATGNLVAATVAQIAALVGGTTAGTLAAGNHLHTGTYVPLSLVDAKGDLLVASADDTLTRVGVGTDGKVPVADTNSPSGLLWARPAPVLHAPLKYTSTGITTTAGGPTANRMYLQPIVMSRRLTIDRLAVNHTATVAGAGSVVRLGIYANGTNGDLPGLLILDAGTIDLTTAAAFKALTMSQVLDPGIYWLACVAQITSGAPALTLLTCLWMACPDAGGPGSGGCQFTSNVSAGLPTPGPPVLGGIVSTPPAIYFRTA
jgi:hypothetical protein